MRTRSQSRNLNRQQQQAPPAFVEPFNLEEPIENPAPPVVTMDDNRTMAQLLEAPTEGYEDAIVVPEITADNFELKHGLLTLVQNKQFFGHDKEDPHAHIRYFNKITSTMKFPNVPSTSVKLMLFPFSLEGAARIWLEKEPPRSILTWDDLVSKFINKFFPPSKTTNLRNEITRFQQRFDETFYEAWDRFNDLLRACPHHGFSKLHQLDTFYNALNSNDQDSLNSAAGGNFLDKMPRDCLRIIKSKSKVRNSRNKPVIAKVSSSSSTPGISPDVAELKDMVKALIPRFEKNKPSSAPVDVDEKRSRKVVLLTVVLILTEIIPPPMATFIVTIFKNMFPKPPQLISTKEIPVIEPRLLIKLDLPVFLPFNKTKEITKTVTTKTRGILSPDLGFYKWYQSLVALDLGFNKQQQGTSKGSQIKRLKHDGQQLCMLILKEYIGLHDFWKQQMWILELLSLWAVVDGSVPPIAGSALWFLLLACSILFVIDLYYRSSDAFGSLNNDDVYRSFWRFSFFALKEEMIYAIEFMIQADGSGTLPSYTITNPNKDLKGITTRSGVAYQGPTIPTTTSSPPKVVEHETEPVVAPVSVPKPNSKPSIPYPSRLNDQKIREKANNQIEKFYQIFQDLHFEISFADALSLMPKFASTLKSLIGNKEKLSEMARTPLNEHCSAVLLEKLPEKLRDPGKFLIPCDFPGMDECLALADLGASINLISLSMWKKVSLPGPTPTCMTLELADRSITQPIGIAEDVDVKVGKLLFKVLSDLMIKKRQHSRVLTERSPIVACLLAYAMHWARSKGEKSHFMVKEGIVLGHKISKNGIEVDKAKVDVIAKLPHPTTVKGVRSFLGHAGFYRRFIKDFSKISRPMTHLLEKNTLFIFSNECIQAFETLKKKLTEAPILIAPDWDLPFELMCDASDFAIGAVLGQRHEKHFRPIHYASKTMNEAKSHYTTIEKEMLAVVTDVPGGKGIRFLNLFNDPRIIREQRIVAYNGYRGGGVVQVLKGTSKGGVEAIISDVEVYGRR
ncbi:reverse transcriptase domain-containing protein [Tanacetum coccineum]|uniref:Reverse transcriptase domain-containing protein n=1 Tax=Tanacetum coccineum TaxID=301880 RepID=A0ABQ5CC77_9ASTR